MHRNTLRFVSALLLASTALLLLATFAQAAPTTSASASHSGKQGKPSTWMSLLFNAPWDQDWHQYVMLGDELSYGGMAFFYDAHGDTIQPPQCKVKLSVKFDTGRGWVKVATTSTYLSPTGNYNGTYRPGKQGSYCMQATIAKGKKYAAGKTLWVAFLVK